MSDGGSTFRFVRLDYAGRFGLSGGRYTVRPPASPGDEPTEVLIVDRLGAPVRTRRRTRRRARPRPANAADPGPTVDVTRFTVVSASPFEMLEAARAWLEKTARDEEALERSIASAVVVVNRALHAHRASAQDPYVPDLSAEGALAIRVGYGGGQELTSGGFSEATEVPRVEARSRRVEALRPQERLAAVLGGRESIDVCETLLLRARADLEAGRLREATVELRGGLAAILAELAGRAGPDQEQDLAELESRRGAVDAAAEAVLRGEPPAAEIEETLGIAERVLRRRRILGSSAPKD